MIWTPYFLPFTRLIWNALCSSRYFGLVQLLITFWGCIILFIDHYVFVPLTLVSSYSFYKIKKVRLQESVRFVQGLNFWCFTTECSLQREINTLRRGNGFWFRLSISLVSDQHFDNVIGNVPWESRWITRSQIGQQKNRPLNIDRWRPI